jgi:hypothetical protein
MLLDTITILFVPQSKEKNTISAYRLLSSQHELAKGNAPPSGQHSCFPVSDRPDAGQPLEGAPSDLLLLEFLRQCDKTVS